MDESVHISISYRSPFLPYLGISIHTSCQDLVHEWFSCVFRQLHRLLVIEERFQSKESKDHLQIKDQRSTYAVIFVMGGFSNEYGRAPSFIIYGRLSISGRSFGYLKAETSKRPNVRLDVEDALVTDGFGRPPGKGAELERGRGLE